MKIKDEYGTKLSVVNYFEKYTNVRLSVPDSPSSFDIDLTKEQAVELAKEILDYYKEEQ